MATSMPSRNVAALCSILGLCGLLACGATSIRSTTHLAHMEAELDAFSGRPNPRWQLTEEDAEKVRQLLSRLPAQTDKAEEPPGLGYRGIVLHMDDGPSGPTSVRVYRGSVVIHDSAGERLFRDRDRTLERLLLTTAERTVDRGLIESLRSSFDR